MIDVRLLQEYQCYLRGLALEQQNQFIVTGGIEHASVLMSELLSHTEKIARIYCYGFKPDLITIGPLWTSLMQFLEEDNHILRILIESSDYINDHPLEMIKHFKKLRNNNSIEVRLLSEESKKIMQKQLGNDFYFFSVFDDNKYRLEVDPELFKSISSFNYPSKCCSLIQLFDKAFHSSCSLF